MVSLNELRNISGSKETKRNVYLESLTTQQRDSMVVDFKCNIKDLEKNLIKAAKLNKKSYNVFEIHSTDRRIHNDLHTLLRRKGSGNFYCAFRDKTITQEDVIDNLLGLPYMIFNYCKENDLNPQIEHFMDGGGLYEGFKIVIKW